MRKCIKEKINKEITIRNAETLAAVERERERGSLYLTCDFLIRLNVAVCLLGNKISNTTENINNTKFNKGRTMPILGKGIGLSLFAFVKETIINKKAYYTYCINNGDFEYAFSRSVRAGPKVNIFSLNI